MFDILTDISLPIVLFLVLLSFLGGVIKGAVGFAMPLFIVSTASMVVDPKIVVAGLVLPILLSNISQMMRQGLPAAIDVIREFWLFALVLCGAIFVSAQLMVAIPIDTILLLLGISVTSLCAIMLSGWKPVLPDRHRTLASVIIGLFAGAMGGLAGTWGPPVVLFMLALNVPKTKQVVAQGVLFGIGGVVLGLATLKSGVLSAYSLPYSLLMVLPVMLGMYAGYGIQDRINQTVFRKATLLVLLLSGLNLIRRGLM